MISNIIIKGERCSGTNYLQLLISANSDFKTCGQHLALTHDEEVEALWKHGMYDDTHAPLNNGNSLFLVIHRNLHDWLRSLYLQPWHLPERDSFYEFLTSSVCCDECGYYYSAMTEYVNGERYCGDIIGLRYIKLQNWMVNLKNYLLIDYDELLLRPGMIMDILRAYGVPVHDGFINWQRYKDSPDDYIKKEYGPMSAAELLYINSKTNVDFEKMLRP
jgi:hypothetical protein